MDEISLGLSCEFFSWVDWVDVMLGIGAVTMDIRNLLIIMDCSV